MQDDIDIQAMVREALRKYREQEAAEAALRAAKLMPEEK